MCEDLTKASKDTEPPETTPAAIEAAVILRFTAEGVPCYSLGYPPEEPSTDLPLKDALDHARRVADIDLIGRCIAINAWLRATATYQLYLSKNLIGARDEVIQDGMSYEEGKKRASELDAIWKRQNPDAQFGARRFHLLQLEPKPAMVRVPLALLSEEVAAHG